MHAPLGATERQLGTICTIELKDDVTDMRSVCADLIEALEQCHARGMLYKFIGGCNIQKKELTQCLRKEVCHASFVPVSLFLSFHLALGTSSRATQQHVRLEILIHLEYTTSEADQSEYIEAGPYGTE